MADGKNVLGGDLVSCSKDPVTGFYRDGCCRTGPDDYGLHIICTRVTYDFLAFSKRTGNDLSTPMPQYGFQGLKEGDQWCVCAERWKEAYDAGAAAPVVLEATHVSALEFVSLDALKKNAVKGSL